jgi:hypothetical protein
MKEWPCLATKRQVGAFPLALGGQAAREAPRMRKTQVATVARIESLCSGNPFPRRLRFC